MIVFAAGLPASSSLSLGVGLNVKQKILLKFYIEVSLVSFFAVVQKLPVLWKILSKNHLFRI